MLLIKSAYLAIRQKWNELECSVDGLWRSKPSPRVDVPVFSQRYTTGVWPCSATSCRRGSSRGWSFPSWPPWSLPPSVSTDTTLRCCWRWTEGSVGWWSSLCVFYSWIKDWGVEKLLCRWQFFFFWFCLCDSNKTNWGLRSVHLTPVLCLAVFSGGTEDAGCLRSSCGRAPERRLGQTDLPAPQKGERPELESGEFNRRQREVLHFERRTQVCGRCSNLAQNVTS